MTDRTDDRRHEGERPALSHAVYGISVASELTDIPVQTLRLWERQGLLAPQRSKGGTRRFSADDITLIRRIAALVADGVNLAGVARILDLRDANEALRDNNKALQEDNDILRSAAGYDFEERQSVHSQRARTDGTRNRARQTG
ncbi:MerR family transcriptional regulator [Mycolicibacterium komossense]|uniref:MerR family transcriptional regulator n=1 Tax=Mycolicibacterium komossense TaxID=1779 RepID=A0ABT3CG01_9MYCO|nr:MerR family transcriptional regulator [Mycolicibacterium komossense]MCV7228434.1 MerR family transcriptional regulator [Mycolicibacterium komossense]